MPLAETQLPPASETNKRLSKNLRTGLEAKWIGTPSTDIAVFERLNSIPGWFNLDDYFHFSMILRMQNQLGLDGDVFEIGSYHGRSTCTLAASLQKNQRIFVCDAFEETTEDPYSNRPSPETLRTNVRRVVPQLDDDRLVIHKCFSNDLKFPADQLFRFIHIDGGHSKEQALFDLRAFSLHLVPKGVIAVDDYGHPDFPGVKEALDQFLAEQEDFKMILDANRHGAKGRKAYIGT